MAIRQQVLRSMGSRTESIHRRGFTSLTESVKLAAQRKTAFLCHSHIDADLVRGLIVLLADVGIDLYVDWQDSSLPATPNAETARGIQQRIRDANLFLFLATGNSKASRWCPWEIGYADACTHNIYIIPTSDEQQSYGNEYLQLYPKIDSGTFTSDGRPGYFVFKPNERGYAVSNNTLI